MPGRMMDHSGEFSIACGIRFQVFLFWKRNNNEESFKLFILEFKEFDPPRVTSFRTTVMFNSHIPAWKRLGH